MDHAFSPTFSLVLDSMTPQRLAVGRHHVKIHLDRQVSVGQVLSDVVGHGYFWGPGRFDAGN